MRTSWFHVRTALILVSLAGGLRQAAAQVFVPGSGKKVAEVGDDFEDPKWNYISNLPKSSNENDQQPRLPGGVAANGRWYEPELRGAPDVDRARRHDARRHSRQQGLDEHEDALLRRSGRAEPYRAARRFCGQCGRQSRLYARLALAKRRDARVRTAVRSMGAAHGQFVRLPRRVPSRPSPNRAAGSSAA